VHGSDFDQREKEGKEKENARLRVLSQNKKNKLLDPLPSLSTLPSEGWREKGKGEKGGKKKDDTSLAFSFLPYHRRWQRKGKGRKKIKEKKGKGKLDLHYTLTYHSTILPHLEVGEDIRKGKKKTVLLLQPFNYAKERERSKERRNICSVCQQRGKGEGKEKGGGEGIRPRGHRRCR